MHVLCIFSMNLTLGFRIKNLHSIVRSRRPIVVPIECPESKTMAPSGPTGPKTESPRTATATQCNKQRETLHAVIRLNNLAIICKFTV